MKIEFVAERSSRGLRGLLVGFAVFFSALPFAAHGNSKYDCSVDGGVQLMIETMPGSRRAEMRGDRDLVQLRPDQYGRYAGVTGDGDGISFDEGRQVLQYSSEQWSCRPLMQQANDSSVGAQINRNGFSFGGKLRSGPGTMFSQAASVREGSPITIVSNSGVDFEGYDWFEIKTENGQRGFQWGGLICARGERLRGTVQECNDTEAASKPAQKQYASGGNGWLVFAIGSKNRWGHGAAPTRNAARKYALSNCGSSSCNIEAETQSLCQALVLGTGTHWFGDGPNTGAAASNALNFCRARSGNCRLEYTYCQ